MNSLLFFYIKTLLFFLIKTGNSAEVNDIIFIQKSIYIGLAILGVAMVVFLYYNFRKNLKRKFKSDSSIGETKIVKSASNTNIKSLSLDEYPQPIAICDQTGIIKFANTAFGKVFGSSPENMRDLLIYNILPSHIATSLTFAADFNKENFGRSKNIFFSPNTQHKYFVRWKKTESDVLSNENIWITLETALDDSLNNIKAVQTQENLLQEIIDFYPMAIFVEDMNGILLSANKKACDLQGIEASQIKSEIISNHSLDEYREELLQQKTSEDITPIIFETIYYPQFGKAIPAEIRAGRITFFDRPALCFIINDISDLVELSKKLDDYKMKSQESDRLKSSFLSNLSHEVRTPLNSILGFSELLAEPEISVKEKYEYLQMVRKSGKNLLIQISNMIDFSKIEAGLVDLKIELYNIETLFHHLHEYATEEQIDEDKVQLLFDLPEEISQNNIVTDRFRLKQILKIFLSNALKYTETGIIEIGVNLRAPQLYEFYVRDTGVGIPEEKHLQIFENFRQANDSKSRGFSGMGLGLSIAARLIQFLGGHQWVVSRPNEGAEFRCVIPDSMYTIDSPVHQVSGGPSTMIKKIMIISPSELIYTNLCRDAKPINYQVFWAQNAEEMKAMLLSNNIRIILIDIDGITFWQELISRIKKIQKDLRIIGVSNTIDTKRKERLITMGLDNVIKTAVNIPVILNIIERNEIPSLNLLTSIFNKN